MTITKTENSFSIITREDYDVRTLQVKEENENSFTLTLKSFNDFYDEPGSETVMASVPKALL